MDDLVTMRDAAIIADVSYQTIYRWVRHGKLRHYRAPGGKKFINPHDLTPQLVKEKTK